MLLKKVVVQEADLPDATKSDGFTWYVAQATFDVLTGYSSAGVPVVQEMHYTGGADTPRSAVSAAIGQASSTARQDVTLEYSIKVDTKTAKVRA